MDDTRTRDARARRELPESLAWLYEQPADEQRPSWEAQPASGPPPAAPAVPPSTLAPVPARAPEDPEALPTLLPFSAPADEPRPYEAIEPFPMPVPPDSLFAPAPWAEPEPPAPQPQEPPAPPRLFDTPRFAQPAPRPIPPENWPTARPADDWFRPQQPEDDLTSAEDVEDDEHVVSEPAAAAPVEDAEPVAAGPVDETHVDEPVADEVHINEHINEDDLHDPFADEIVVHEPVADEPVADEPVADEPVADEPADEVAVHEPVIHEPVVDEIVVHEPPAAVVPPPPDLADPALGPVWTAVRETLQSPGRHVQPAVDVRGLDQGGRRALAGLLRVPTVRAATRVDLAELEAAVAAVGGMSLAAAAERFVPLGTGRRARTQTRTAAVRAAQEWLAAHPDMAALPWTATWLETIRRDITSGDAGLTGHEVISALAVLESLTHAGAANEPAGWRVRTEVAAQVADDEHALDEGSAVAALVLRGLAASAGTSMPADAAGRRRLWARYGVLPDLVSASCLAVGVGPADDVRGRRWRLAALDGAPVHVTARDLRDDDAWAPVDDAWPAVLVVDHPRVLQAIAERFGGRVPTVWVDGTCDLVALDLVARLHEAGTPVRFVTDFDRHGLALGSLLVDRFGAQPWRMTADVYRGAVRSDLPPLAGRAPDPEWAPELGTAMAQTGRALPLEQVLADVLGALARELEGAGAAAAV